MTDTPNAYAQAIDQLRARAEAAEKDRDMYLRLSNEETEAKVAFRGERDAALARAETAEKERGEWERSHGEVVEFIGTLAGLLHVTRGGQDSFEGWAGRITAALGEIRAQLEAVTTERDDLAQKLSGDWIEREVDARLMAELQGSPVAHERNQLRDEVAELRAQLKAQSDGLNKYWQEQVRLAKAEGRRRARNLAAMLHAHVNAIAGEDP